MSTKNRTRRTTTRNIRFPNQMISQTTTSLLAKRVREFLKLGHWSLPSETNVRKESIYITKSDEEWTSRVLPSEQDDIVNSLNYEGIAVIELQFYHFPDSDRLRWLCHRLKKFKWLAVMVISQPPGISHIIIVLHQRCLNCSECFQRHLMFALRNYNIRVTHRNGAKHIYTNQIHGGIISRLFFIHFVAPCAVLHLAVVTYFKSFCMKILSTLALHTSVGCISLQNASRTAICYATNTIAKTFLIFDINHQQNTRRSDQIETIKR